MILEVLGFFLVGYILYFFVSVLLESFRHLPPGPFPVPILGNLHLLSNRPHLDLTQLGQRYGPVYRLQIGSQRAVVICSYVIAREAMIKNGTDFAGRASHFVGSQFSRNGKGIGFQTFTPVWKRQQKTIQKTLKDFENGNKHLSLEDIIAKEIEELCTRFMRRRNEPFDPRADATFALGNIVGTVAFAKRYAEGDQEFWQLMDALTIFVEGLAATSFIDAFPFLKYVPFSILQRVNKAVAMRDEVLNKKYLEHKEDHEECSEVYERDLTDALLIAANKKSRGNPEDAMTEDHIVMTVNDTIMAGSETPTMTLLWIIYCFVKYPDVQQRVQRELDDVIGRDRLPSWRDRASLPYLESFVAEVLRYTGVMPLAIPHQAIEDTFLGGYHIPKGTRALLNIWAIHHDPKYWEAPMEFRPERFLDKDGHFSTEDTPSFIPYGIGHRSCPGESLARMETFLFTAHLLHSLRFRCAEGEVLPDIMDCEFGITLRPAPFKICVSARD